MSYNISNMMYLIIGYLNICSISNNFGMLSSIRSSRPEVFCKKDVLRNFVKFTRKYLWKSLFFNKVAGWGLQLYFKKRLWHRCFPVNLQNFYLLEHLFLQNTSGGCFYVQDKDIIVHIFLQGRRHYGRWGALAHFFAK